MKLKYNIPCRFHPRCSDIATAIYYVPQGCICWDDPVQALCNQHAYKAETDGPFKLIDKIDYIK